MKVLSSPLAVARASREAEGPVVLVPTMGALHRGHLALVDQGRRRAGKSGLLVVSLFVNPAQFGPAEDFSRYPRPFAADRRLCEEAGVDIVFRPDARQIYAPDHSTWVEETALSSGLCGASRPGHFRGVCTVVLDLFHIVSPDIAIFGEKDYQQLAIIRRMARDLHLRIRILGGPIVREPDGLALSSRNRYLTPEERADAPLLRRGLLNAAEAATSRGSTPRQLRDTVARTLARSPHARVDYISVVDAATLEPLTAIRRPFVVAAAVYFGKTRLIDNLRVS